MPNPRVIAAVGCLAIACGGATSQDQAAPADASVPDRAVPLEPLSAWLSISDVAVFQGPKAPIFANGAPVAKLDTPVIAARPAMVRFYLKMLEKRTKAHQLEADLHVISGGAEVAVAHDQGLVSTDSTDDQVDSGFKFALDAAVIKPDTTCTLVVHDLTLPANGPDPTLTFPSDGSQLALQADATAPEVKITFVPIRYDADGSGRLPDTSPAQISGFHDTLYRMYPAATITTTVAPPLPFPTALDAQGTGWDSLVSATMNQRATDNASDDVYYVALFAITDSFYTYCAGGCIGGVGLLQGAGDPTSRVAVVADYNVQFARDTLNQELAHAMGRLHAPCGGPANVDPKFPYPDGSPGVWGYDVLESSWVDPTTVSDFMSYCHPIGVSDYTYAALYKEMKYVQKTKTMSVLPPQRMHALRVLADGSVRDGGFMHVKSAPQGASRHTELVDGLGRLVVSSDRFVSYDELGGGIALVPEGTAIDGIVRARP